MNTLDFIVIALLLFFIIYGYIKGFFIMALGLCSFLLSILLAYFIYPHVGKFLRTTGLFDYLKSRITTTLGLDSFLKTTSKAAEISVIESLPLPDFIKSALLENNNTVVYDSLNSLGLADYIAGAISSLILNVISLIVVLVAVFIIMKLLSMTLKFVSKIPVVSIVNRIIGAFVGLIEGSVICWLVLGALMILFSTNPNFPVAELMRTSLLAEWFNERNFVIEMIVKLFP